MTNNKELNLNLSAYQGSIDLLLTLIEHKNIAIKDIDIAELADQYQDFMDNAIYDVDLEILSDYLKTASILVNLKIKSICKFISTKPVDIEAEKQILFDKLYKLEAFKKVGTTLAEAQIYRNALFSKDPDNYDEYKNNAKKQVEIPEFESIDKFYLAEMFNKITSSYVKSNNIDDDFYTNDDYMVEDFDYTDENAEHFHNKISMQPLSIKEVIDKIINYFCDNNLSLSKFSKCFYTIFGNNTNEFYFTYYFLAILLLNRDQIIKIDNSTYDFTLSFYKENISLLNIDKEQYD